MTRTVLRETNERRHGAVITRFAVSLFLSLFIPTLAFPTLAAAQTVAVPPIPASLQAIFAGRPPKTVDDLRGMETHFKQLSQAATACTVSVQYGAALGSGVLVSPDGLVLTVAHIVGEPGKAINVRFADGRLVRGRSLGMHRELDAGIVRLDDPGPWPCLDISEQPAKPGQWCAALGHPGGPDVERGPVFRIGRVLEVRDLIRTDCQLIGGDSGGPLIDMQGKVIGVHSRIGTSLVNNLHVPVSVYRDYWDGLLAGQLWQSRAFIGLRGESKEPPAKVAFVHKNSPADRAGILPGDIVTRFAGVPVHRFPQLVRLVRDHQPGETIRLSLQRDDSALELDVTLERKVAAEPPVHAAFIP